MPAPRNDRPVKTPVSAVNGDESNRALMSPSVFVVVPAYNEQTVIGKVIGELRRLSATVVVIDDGSDDETGSVARKAGAIVVAHSLNRGQGAALQTGLDYCMRRGAEVIATFDADGQHSVEDVPSLVLPILRGEADVVLGSRFLGTAVDISFLRKVILKIGVQFTRLLSGARLTDTHNGIRAFSASAAACIHLTQDRMAHASQIIDQIIAAELDVMEMPVSIQYTDYSRSKGQRSAGAVRVAVDYLMGRVAR